jgi:thiazole synthase ThiGH ThiG subunit
MELGADAILMNTAIAAAEKKLYAAASSPLAGVVGRA